MTSWVYAMLLSNVSDGNCGLSRFSQTQKSTCSSSENTVFIKELTAFFLQFRRIVWGKKVTRLLDKSFIKSVRPKSPQERNTHWNFVLSKSHFYSNTSASILCQSRKFLVETFLYQIQMKQNEAETKNHWTKTLKPRRKAKKRRTFISIFDAAPRTVDDSLKKNKQNIIHTLERC